MNQTYAVINKQKQPHHPTGPAPESPAPSHLYDNDRPVAAGHAVYSEIKPRAKQISLAAPAKPVFSPAASANQREGSSDNNKTSELVAGFNCRVKKPRGPRELPSYWSRLEK